MWTFPRYIKLEEQYTWIDTFQTLASNNQREISSWIEHSNMHVLLTTSSNLTIISKTHYQFTWKMSTRHTWYRSSLNTVSHTQPMKQNTSEKHRRPWACRGTWKATNRANILLDKFKNFFLILESVRVLTPPHAAHSESQHVRYLRKMECCIQS